MNIAFAMAVLLVAAVILLAVVPVATAHDSASCVISGCRFAASKHCGDGVDVCMTHENSCAGCLRTVQANNNASAEYRDALRLYHASYAWDAFVYYGIAAAVVVCWAVFFCVAVRALPDSSGGLMAGALGGVLFSLWTIGARTVLEYFIVVPPLGPVKHACIA